MPFEPIVPDGQHLGNSHQVDGAFTGHLFDDGTNELKGHAAWRWVDEPDEDHSWGYEHEPPRKLTQEELEQAAQLAVLIGAFIVGLAVAAKPHVERWWNKAVPAAKSVWMRVATLRKSKKPVTSTESLSEIRTFVASPSGVEITVAESKVKMSSAEWAHRFRAVLAAGAFRDEQLRILSNARIEDAGRGLEGRTVADELTPRQFIDRIKRMLEANPLLLEEETSAELMRIFGTRPNGSRDSGKLELN